jgi:hypothetical protein
MLPPAGEPLPGNAVDFRVAGVDAQEYPTMTDLCRYPGVE